MSGWIGKTIDSFFFELKNIFGAMVLNVLLKPFPTLYKSSDLNSSTTYIKSGSNGTGTCSAITRLIRSIEFCATNRE